MPLVERKRALATQRRINALAEHDHAALNRVRALIEAHPVQVPTELLILALTDPSRCALCISAFASCPVHVA